MEFDKRDSGLVVPRDPNRVWRGEDASVAKGIILSPGVTSFVTTHFKEGCFPPNLTELEAERMQASGRSRLVQVGAAPSRHTSGIAVATYLGVQEKGETSFDCVIPLENLSERAVRLERGDRIFSPYLVPEEPIRNGDLIELVEENTIQIDGKQGDNDRGGDWDYYHEYDSKDKLDITGIALRIKKPRYYIPYNPEPVYMPTNIADYRRKAKEYWVDTKKRQNHSVPVLWFGTTVPTNFEFPVIAEIDPQAYPHFKKNTPHGHAWTHHESRFLGSKDSWEIVGEFFSPTDGPEAVEWMVLRFFRQ